MSRRAASRLESLGYRNVYVYPGAKADWMAFGPPIEGDHASDPTAGTVARHDVPTCALTDSLGHVRQRLQDSEWSSCIVVDEHGVVLGRLRGKALEGDANQRAEDVMEDGPTTIRPSTELPDLVKRMHDRGVATVVVTNSDGVLFGVLRRDDADRALSTPG